MLRIKEKLANGEVVRLIGVGRLMHHNFLQIVGIQGGFDGVWFDHEHVGFAMENLEVASLAARSVGLENFVRVAPTDYALVTRCLESGGGGVMAAQIYTPEQAEEFVQWSKFYPRGRRGLNTGGFDGKFGSIPAKQFCPQANENSFVAIQIETRESVDNVDAIAAIDGVDLLFVGPSDLSQSFGVTGDFFHADCLAAIDKVAAACKKHGKHWGAVTLGPEHTEMMYEKGCRMISPISDSKLVALGMNALKTQYSKLFGM